ncbi:aminoglycoside phosphotransferase (APT) family kinase protein [Streptomyces sp. SAI-117]|uniref:phosphotransferase n=1 Tax=unclassified Streptomyces TaxID=2593676 RepID=UPI0024746700|nr:MULTISPECIES: phosphotransferase [unclassified Streptomyces]MDH6572434.1 aminoglycoside phosphotransferase (APT) family kinase protein [Streptomyces sp. SAI-117]MDH6582607.1 aminoglycoside phosphotransferase (APT) family kinase protein [Streptomyces sp. SAI-133]
MEESVLDGGAVNEVVRIGETVRRPPSERPGFVRELLALFESAGWRGAPRYLGVDELGREIFAHVEGQAAVTPRERAAARTDEALVEVARLVREFHDLTHGTALAGDRDVVCHNDLAPKNTVYTAWRPTAFIDWDLAAPGERMHDIAHVCWQYLDLGPGVTDVGSTARRIRLICDAYGLDRRDGLLDTVLWWQDRCRRGIEAGALRGERAMIGLRERGVVDEVRAAERWVAGHLRELGAFLT